MSMNLLVLISRILHVGLGVFWAGTIFFVVLLLEPSVRSVGPEGGRVMQALQKRGMLTILPVAAALTILSGGFLYWRMFRDFGMEWVTTPFGTALTIGGVASLVAFGQGFFVMRPATLKVGKLSALLGSTPDSGDRDALVVQIAVLKTRSRTTARWVALWLGVAVVTMAVARYL
ncbi:MAG: hypothetical protein MUO50_04035 [Longimicrobiales bacterium]|nr:hypothetical protein [Longimicrobiales bacterium]